MTASPWLPGMARPKSSDKKDGGGPEAHPLCHREKRVSAGNQFFHQPHGSEEKHPIAGPFPNHPRPRCRRRRNYARRPQTRNRQIEAA